MKYILALLVTVAVAVKAQDTYATVYDNLDVEAVVADENMFKSFTGCFTETAPCTEVAAAFKEELPEAIVQACAKCTKAQKHIVNVFVEGFKKKMPQEYEHFKDTFDLERKYFANFEAAVAGF